MTFLTGFGNSGSNSYGSTTGANSAPDMLAAFLEAFKEFFSNSGWLSNLIKSLSSATNEGKVDLQKKMMELSPDYKYQQALWHQKLWDLYNGAPSKENQLKEYSKSPVEGLGARRPTSLTGTSSSGSNTPSWANELDNKWQQYKLESYLTGGNQQGGTKNYSPSVEGNRASQWNNLVDGGGNYASPDEETIGDPSNFDAATVETADGAKIPNYIYDPNVQNKLKATLGNFQGIVQNPVTGTHADKAYKNWAASKISGDYSGSQEKNELLKKSRQTLLNILYQMFSKQ